jgi:hypothetical protein
MDPSDVEDVHADIRAAMRRSGIEIAEPERYSDEEQGKRSTKRVVTA